MFVLVVNQCQLLERYKILKIFQFLLKKMDERHKRDSQTVTCTKYALEESNREIEKLRGKKLGML